MASAVSHLPNNAAAWWFRDPGLRRLSLGILVGFLSSVNYGESESECERSEHETMQKQHAGELDSGTGVISGLAVSRKQSSR